MGLMLERRKIILSALVLGGGLLPFKMLKANEQSLKIGYLPIMDHLLITAKALYNASFTPIKFSSWADLSEALRVKAIDGSFILTPLALKLKSQGLDIKALLATHRNGSALVLRKGLIKDSSDVLKLKGLKIAIPSRFSSHYLLLAHLLEQAKLSPKDIKLVDMPPPEMVFSLIAKSIDGFIVAEPFGYIAQTKDIADVFCLSKDIINNHICCVLTFHNEVLASKKNEVLKSIKAFVKTANTVCNNSQEVANVAQRFLGQKPQLINNLLHDNDRVVFKDLRLQEEDIKQAISDMNKYGIANIEISYKDFVDNSFLDHIRIGA